MQQKSPTLSQSTVDAAMVYRHVADGRDAVIAERMAQLAEPNLSASPAPAKKRIVRRRRMTDAELASFTDRARPITDHIAEQISYGGYLDILLAKAGHVLALDAAIDMAAQRGVALPAETQDLAADLLQDLDAYDVLVLENRILEKLAKLPVDS